MPNPKKNCCVVVLGDFGRSPRMQYHTKSLLEEGFDIDIVSYGESKPLQSIQSNISARFHLLRKFPEVKLPSLIKYILKTIWQAINLLMVLCAIPKPAFVLMQNPPAVPAVFICYIYCKIRKSRFVIDWHNYTFSILALNSNPNGLLVKISHWIEKLFGQKADVNFCVTKAMKTDLNNNWSIEAIVLYDRPPEQFRPVSIETAHKLFLKLSKDYKHFASEDKSETSKFLESTVLTRKEMNGHIIYNEKRPAILISSTSWTPDEDFGILLTALNEYDELARNYACYPNLLCIITGKGPQKEYYEELVSKKSWEKVTVITPWLTAEDYPPLLASADLGVCLHWSSSSLDLPMKIVDMFGVGLTVCAKNFSCLHELVQHEKNGFVFETPIELTQQLAMWFKDFPNNPEVESKKRMFQRNLEHFNSLRWRENWKLVAQPVLNIDS